MRKSEFHLSPLAISPVIEARQISGHTQIFIFLYNKDKIKWCLSHRDIDISVVYRLSTLIPKQKFNKTEC
jgi:hypothetical protein